MKLRQSYLSSISPDTVVLTDRRVIIVHNSFWGLYINRNILTPTRISTVILNNIMGTTTTNGKILSTVHIRIRGSGEDAMAPGSGWHIEGLRIRKAVAFTGLLEEFIETKEDKDVQTVGVDLEQIKEILKDGKSALVWLGVESVDYVSYLLGIDKSRIIRVNPPDIPSMSMGGLKAFEGKVFVCYSGNISEEMASLFKREYNLDVFYLKGGLMKVIGLNRKEKDNKMFREN